MSLNELRYVSVYSSSMAGLHNRDNWSCFQFYEGFDLKSNKFISSGFCTVTVMFEVKTNLTRQCLDVYTPRPSVPISFFCWGRDSWGFPFQFCPGVSFLTSPSWLFLFKEPPSYLILFTGRRGLLPACPSASVNRDSPAPYLRIHKSENITFPRISDVVGSNYFFNMLDPQSPSKLPLEADYCFVVLNLMSLTFKARSHWAKAKEKTKNFFDICR